MNEMPTNFTMKESYEWVIPEFKTGDHASSKKIYIKGVALFSDTVSKNSRKYVAEELVKSARTLVGKPITINHDDTRVVGNVIFAEPNEDRLEYIGEVNDWEYVQKLRDKFDASISEEEYLGKWDATPIEGVSVQADYLYNRCPECGEFFTDLGIFNSHMHELHNIRSNLTEPRGIVHNHLSLVEDPESPGITGTTVELWETANSGMLQLLETVTTIGAKLEAKTLKRAAITSDTRLAFGRTRTKPTISEQDEEPAQEPCPEGQHRNDAGECVPDEVEEQEECPEGQHMVDGECVDDEPEPVEEQLDKGCEEGFHPDPVTGECIPNEPLQEQEECPEGQHRDIDTGECVPNVVAEQEQAECPEGFHKDDQGECVPDEVPKDEAVALEIDAPSIVVEGVKYERTPDTVSIEELTLGEPFADYDSFEDCVAKNSGKDDPEAYCAEIQREAEPAAESLALKHTMEERELKWKHSMEALRKELTSTNDVASRNTAKINLLRKGTLEASRNQQRIAETVNTITANLQQIASRPNLAPEVNAKLKEIREQINASFATMTTHINDAMTASRADTAKRMATMESQMRAHKSTLTKQFNAEHTRVSSLFNTANARIKEIRGQIPPLAAQFKTGQDDVQKRIEAAMQRIVETTALVGEQKLDYERILDALEDKYQTATTPLKERIEALETENAELTEKQEAHDQKVKELKETHQIEKENLEAQIKPQYTAPQKSIEETDTNAEPAKKAWRQEAE
jgi:hypothetical protein